MMRNKKEPRQMRSGEQKSFHLVEFSKGKPHEISFDVLDNLSAGNQKKKSFLGGLFSRNKGSAETLTPEDFAHISSVQNQSEDSSEGTKGFTTNQTDAFSPAQNKAARKSLGFRNAKAEERAKHHSGSQSLTPNYMFTSDSVDEVNRRKSHRKLIGVTSVLIIVAVCVGIFGVGGKFLYEKHLEEMSNIELLQEGLKEIEVADTTIVSIDEFLSTPYNDSTADQARVLLSEIPEARNHLATAKTYTQKANEGLSGSSEDKQASEYALNSIASRETLLDVSEQFVQLDLDTKETLDSLKQAEELIKQAEEMLKQSAEVVSNTSEETVAKSTELTNEAKALFEEARPYCQKTVDVFGQDAVGVYTSYVDKRIAACDEALASNEAILLQDRATAEAHNEKYNVLDKEVAELAKTFEQSFYQPIYDQYEIVVTDLKSQYDALRSDMATTDAHLRAYLGTES
ncbi:MAG: hypothetical protein ACI4BI_04660 [Anaerotardibacter sp.]